MIRGLIFDLDGTLVDSLPGIAAALNHSLAKHDFPTHSHEEIKSFIGDGIVTLISRALQTENHPQIASLVKEFQTHYAANWQDGTTVYPGMLELLEELHQARIPLAVLSNKPHAYTVEIVDSLFPSHLFDPIRGHEERFPKKPDPTTVLQIVEKWGLSAQEVAYVGDSTVDLATARAGQLQPLIFSWGYGTPTDLPLLDSVDDLRQQVLS